MRSIFHTIPQAIKMSFLCFALCFAYALECFFDGIVVLCVVMVVALVVLSEKSRKESDKFCA
jgi:hypothetical protein